MLNVGTIFVLGDTPVELATFLIEGNGDKVVLLLDNETLLEIFLVACVTIENTGLLVGKSLELIKFCFFLIETTFVKVVAFLLCKSELKNFVMGLFATDG